MKTEEVEMIFNYSLKLLENFLAGTAVADELVTDLDHDILNYIDVDLAGGSRHQERTVSLEEFPSVSNNCSFTNDLRKVQWKGQRGIMKNCRLGFVRRVKSEN